MNEKELRITKIEIEGELPAGCPWCPFDKLSGAHDPCSVSGCLKSSYGYRPDGCKLAKRTDQVPEA